MVTKIAITFDVERHGVCPSAILIPLKILDQYKIKATFFVLGRFADQNPKVPEEILSRGHELGCHGYVHYPPYDEREYDDVRRDVEKGTKVMSRFGDVANFRSPYFRPHKKLATILDSLSYRCDSSVPSKRFDMFIGRTSNPYNLLCPMKPYHPSKENIFVKGESEIAEIPLSGFIFPLLGVTMRNMGFRLFARLVDFVNIFSDVIVLDVHTWEFLEAPEARIRHRRKRGTEIAIMFDALLRYLKRKGTFIVLSDIINKNRDIVS